MTYFILPEGIQGKDREVWKALRSDPEKRWVRHYQNDRFRLEIEWIGGPFDDKTPIEHAAPWKSVLWNITRNDSEGNPYPTPKKTLDPAEQYTFRAVKEAIDYYEDFLVKNSTGCEWCNGEDGRPRFLERGNLLAPASKDVPALPPPEQVSQETLDAMGSW